MMEIALLLLGFGLVLLFMHDFFFTTLSVGGAGVISQRIANLANRILHHLVGQLGRRMYKYHGLLVNLAVLLMWVILVWIGLFLIFSYNPEGITNSNGEVADIWERLYFTGYTLSTLGLGNIEPNTAFFQVMTSCFSFLGFIFFTSSMTYFISVSSAVVNKGTLAKSIYNLGDNPQKIADKLLSLDSSYSYQQALNLQEMIDRHTENHEAYPVVHFFSRSKPKNCFSLNIARLDEAISILLYSKEAENIRKELTPLRAALDHFIENTTEGFSNFMPKEKETVKPSVFPYRIEGVNEKELEARRQALDRLIRSEGFTWKDVV